MKILNKSKGFTLIELLIVMAILGILSGILLVNLQGMRSRARDARRKADLDAISKSLLLYSNNHGSYPASTASFEIEGCDSYTTPISCPWGSAFEVGTTTFMGRLPLDPLTTATTPAYYDYYSPGPTNTEFIVVSELEIASDLDGSDSIAKCNSLYSQYVTAKGPTYTAGDNPYVSCSN